MSIEVFPTRALRRDTGAIDDRLLLSLVAAGLPVPLAIGLGMGYEMMTGQTAVGAVGTNVSYGLALLLTLGTITLVLSQNERRAVFNFERMSRTELVWTALGFPLGTAAFLGGTVAMNSVGLTVGGYEYTLNDPRTVAAVVFGAVLVAPFVEEVLFRGFLLGSLLGRGLSPTVAGIVSIVAFGILHVALLGIAGVVMTALWSVVPTVLRLRFNSLTGPWLLHLVNNVWAYLGVVALGIR